MVLHLKSKTYKKNKTSKTSKKNARTIKNRIRHTKNKHTKKMKGGYIVSTIADSIHNSYKKGTPAGYVQAAVKTVGLFTPGVGAIIGMSSLKDIPEAARGLRNAYREARTNLKKKVNEHPKEHPKEHPNEVPL